MNKMYCVRNIETNKFLDYAEKKQCFFSNKIKYYTVESPFPSLRPKEHIKKCFNVWIKNTPDPKKYKVVEWILQK